MKLTEKQEQAQQVLAGPASNIMLFGGSRSGKTFLLMRTVIVRALKAPNSRHVALRFRFNAIKASIVFDTFPRVMSLCFPGVTYHLNKTDWFAKFDNGSEIWFSGIDDKERVERILGMEFVTAFANETSQIPWSSIGIVKTRLAQQVMQNIGGIESTMRPRFLYDCNPPSKAHWSYKVFIQKIDPDTREAIRRQEDYESFQINPQDNRENIASSYFSTLEGLSTKQQKRFLKGEFADATPNQLFSEDDIEKWRKIDGDLPDFVRVVVGVDPSGSGDVENADNDAIGITVGAIGTDGIAYLLEDCTVKAGPGTWGRVAASAYDRHQADIVVGEVNYGGAMVQQTIQVARPRTPFKAVTASRGKHVRAEPYSALYEQGKIRHVGNFPELEDELAAFSTLGYMGENSPNRADAWIWTLSELFPGMVRKGKSEKPVITYQPNVFAG